MINHFNTDMPLPEMVSHSSSSGVLFFQNHNHAGSYQILERAMPAFKQANVKHFYIELPPHLFQSALTEHFNNPTKKNALDHAFATICESQRKYLQPLVEAAHLAGIKTLAVDVNTVLNHKHLAGDTNIVASIKNQRVMQDNQITALMQQYIKKLSQDEKYIGLLGGHHIQIGKTLKTCLVCLQSMSLEGGKDHLNLLPNEVQGGDEQSDKLLKEFDVITLVPQDLDDIVDLSQPISDNKYLPYFNRLLQALQLPQCEAYKYTKSSKIVAAFIIPTADLNTTWPRVVSLMDPFAKRSEPLPNDKTAIIFENINDSSHQQLVISSLVNLLKQQQSTQK